MSKARVVWKKNNMHVEIEDGAAYAVYRIPIQEAPMPTPLDASAIISEGRMAEVFELLRARRSNKEIAAALNIAESTVKFHVSAILTRLGCSSRAEIIYKYGHRN